MTGTPAAPLHLADHEFRELAERVSELAAGLLAGLDDAPAFPPRATDSLTAFEAPPPLEGCGARAFDDLQRVLDLSRSPTGRFFGYVLGSGEPVAALGDFLASVLNQNVTAWRSSPAAVSIERQVVQWLAAFIGCPHLTGSLCGGGSMANLMALTMAREARCPANENGATPAVVYASSEVHMSIPKAVALLGLGRRNLTQVPVDAEFRMDVAALERAITADMAAGRRPLAVVATAGTVNTGAIDPLQQIAAICERHNLWLHVDGAYGALAAAAVPEKFVGLERVDSVSLDAHKWLYQPLDCGVLLFRNVEHAIRAFSHSGDYARSLESDPARAFSYFEQSIELSRRFRALKLWLSLRYHGLDAYRSAIRADLEHAAQLTVRVAENAALELLAPATLSAVCFRCRVRSTREPAPTISADELNAAVLRRVIERGRVYLSNATIRGEFALRACFVNHRTKPTDIPLIVSEVLAAAAEVRNPAT